jgi:hypothetical protein
MTAGIKARARELVHKFAERFGLVDRRCVKSGKVGCCEKAAFDECDCPRVMHPDDEKVVTDLVEAALIAANVEGLREAREVASRQYGWDVSVWLDMTKKDMTRLMAEAIVAAIDARIAELPPPPTDTPVS